MIKNWKRIAAALLVAGMIAGCGSAGEALQTVNAVADAVDAVTGYAVTEDTAEDTEASSVADAAEEAVADRPDDADAEEIDPGFSADAEAADLDEAVTDGSGDDLTEIEPSDEAAAVDDGASVLDEDGYYYDKDNVALYLVTYHKLPANYITKKEAQALGWEGGALEPYAHDMSIGGDHFGNYEGLLPEDNDYHECDIDTQGRKRGAKRIIYSDDWDIYYTEDHYETFELLYEGN